MSVSRTFRISLVVVIIGTVFATTADAGFFDRYYGKFFSRYSRKRRPNIAEYVIKKNERTGKFDTLLAALTAVSEAPGQPDLIDALSNDGPFTVFAPTDKAFAEAGLNPDNVGSAFPDISDLTDILLYHVTAGKKRAINLLFERDIEMLNGDEAEFDFSFRPFGFFINDAKVIDANNRASNGIVHVINSVLLPPPDEMPVSSRASLSIVSVPEPSSFGMLAVAALSIGFMRQSRLRTQSS